MKKISPITAAVVFAGAAALLSGAALSLPLGFPGWPARLNSAMFLCLAAYAAWLAQLSARPIRAVAAPLLMLAVVPFVAAAPAGFALPAAAGLAWVRSGICFPGPVARRAAAETITAAGGLALCAALRPPGTAGWALAVGMFFLVQALYFAIVDPVPASCWGRSSGDPRAFLHTRTQELLREQRLERAFSELQSPPQSGSDG